MDEKLNFGRIKMTQEKLNADIFASIKENLPGITADAVTERLKEYEDLVKENARYVKSIAAFNKQVEALKSENDHWLERANDIEHRERELKNGIKLLEEDRKVLDNDANQLQIERLQTQLNCEKDKSDFVKEVSLGLVRNTEFRKSVYRDEPVMDGAYQCGTKSTTETTTESVE